MAKIEIAKPSKEPISYMTVLGNYGIARLCQQTQSAIISTGTELEKVISNYASVIIKDLDSFLSDVENEEIEMVPGIYCCPKDTFKKYSERIKKQEPDMLLFSLGIKKHVCYILELKLGSDFDTKKSAAEKNTLEKCVSILGPKLSFKTEYRFCCFNASTKDEIVIGTKNAFDKEHVWTGKDLCEVMNIDYKHVCSELSKDKTNNYDYFISTVMSEVYKEHISEQDFYDCDDN